MRKRFAAPLGTLFLLSCLLILTAFDNSPKPGQVLDEALLAGRDAASFPPADEDYFHDMDGGIDLTAGAPENDKLALVKGRNTWVVWTAGNDRLWNTLIYRSAGA